MREAQKWQRITDGKVAGHEFLDNAQARSTSLGEACDWMMVGSRAATKPNAKNVRANLLKCTKGTFKIPSLQKAIVQ